MITARSVALPRGGLDAALPANGPTAPQATHVDAAGSSPDAIGAMLSSGLTQLQRVRAGARSPSPALASAVSKLQTAARAFARTVSGGLADALGELMRLQSKRTDDRLALAKGQLKERYDKLIQQTKKALEAIKQRIEAAKGSGFWSTFIKVFKVTAAVATLAAGVVSGNPLLLAGALLSIAGMITNMVSDSEAAMWIGLGLSLAGATCSAGAAFGSPGIPGLSQLANLSGKLSGDTLNLALGLGVTASNGMAAASALPQGLAEADRLNAHADLMDARAARKRAVKDAEQERELIQTIVQAQQRGVEVINKILQTHAGAEAAATI